MWYRFRHLLWCPVASKSQRARTAEDQLPPPPPGAQLGPTAAQGTFTVLGEYEPGVGRTPSRGQWGRRAHPTPLSQSCCPGFSGLGELPRKLSGPSRPCPGGLHLVLG